ncbi:hypothetical protein [Kosakonia cowanii]|jgi:hypothetical protein|uniref:hypothetical protein n=1 Tax=Kosakonia cowanii TaxID=208223 RepID=UPI0025A959CC|nr:hypothetical protein [Kosakonia cowanii]MDM9617128.1 hypothetical protein [Kosakonia cowanii]MDP4562239.1 hypothetical protein [Kosakonia cowanii]
MPDKRERHPAYSAAQLPDGGFALSGLQKRAYSYIDAFFSSNFTARGCVPAEIGEPKRE